MLYLEHTGTRDLIPDLAERIGKAGLSALVLRQNTTSAENREAWVKKKLSEGDYSILIVNPRLVVITPVLITVYVFSGFAAVHIIILYTDSGAPIPIFKLSFEFEDPHSSPYPWAHASRHQDASS